ncbi:pentatricopeptide repeat-containing protein At3g02650, mitochondrial [Mercurialis annua]|uniref:pentatricopeptide repeat-containing protein At3g02650, mitochondrial n=1 Tax=Mercurialis annua TaxID=3986 RepID=UPI002160B1AA|nr:pentatricopeptide repeat-containing protein At3g02650, mitochondrial [Mercurialis annua]XP_050205179.1 pentatricopeptide repeat-containing protein At3g02650, mitochondrial [Mercurialis annua]XP_050205180.1 pentatricopeptide repeat-containing protein At3g02650, mitochondrial [Mercurialis annua]XP_050205181.1 pentatricopeptide repeat-containing protein At3g02650, mitochondrial [Mercurialis annua]
MWRSITVKLHRRVACNLTGTLTASGKVTQSQFSNQIPLFPNHHIQTLNIRFLSNSSQYTTAAATDTDTDHSSLVSRSSLNPNDNDETNFTHTHLEKIDTQLEIPSNFSENGDTQLESDDLSRPLTMSLPEDVGSYQIDSVKLENVLSLLQSSTDATLESTLDQMGLILHEDFVLKVLQTPLVLGDNLIKFFNWAMKNSDITVSTTLVDALVRAICSELRKRDAYALWDLVKDIGEKENSVLNVDMLNQLIALFSKLGKGKAAFEVFNKFEDFGCVPDLETYYFTIEALCRRSFFDWAASVGEKMLSAEALPDSEKIGKIICWFCKGDKANDAHMVYMLAKEKNQYPPQSSVNFLISLLCKKDDTVKLAVEMLDDFSGSTRKYAIKPFSSVIHGLCRIKDLDGAKLLLSKMIDEGPPPSNAVFNSIINAYSKSGDMNEALEMKKLMEKRGLKPDLFTYTVIMSGYASGGQMEEASKLLSEAKKKHSKLSPVIYHTLVRGYSKLEQFDKALSLLEEMKKFGVQVNSDEYNKLIQSLCLKALDWETSEKLLEKMKEDGLHLNGITRGLIRAVKELELEGIEKESSVEA